MNSQVASPRLRQRISRPCTSTLKASEHQPAEYPALNRQPQLDKVRPRCLRVSDSNVFG